MTEHVEGRQERQEFHRELGAIDAKVAELFTMVAEDLPARSMRSCMATARLSGR